MAKLVCHAEKYKKGSVVSLERHNERKNINYSNKEIDPARMHLNYSLIQREEERYYRSVMKLVNARDNPSGRALRKDAVVLCEFIISSGNEFFEGISEAEQRRFFEEANRYLQEFFGKEHCIYAVVHYDEHTPHMHFGFVPLTPENKLCAKEVIDRAVLLRLQNGMPKFLQEKGFQIERGEAGSAAVHKTVRRYKADMEKEKAVLSASIAKEKHVLFSLQKENEVLKTENAAMKEQLDKRPSVRERLRVATMESELGNCGCLRSGQKNLCQSMAYRIISGKRSYILIIGICKRYVLRKTESEYCNRGKDAGMDLTFTKEQQLNIKKALKRGIYQELYDRDYLTNTQLNELIRRNT